MILYHASILAHCASLVAKSVEVVALISETNTSVILLSVVPVPEVSRLVMDLNDEVVGNNVAVNVLVGVIETARSTKR